MFVIYLIHVLQRIEERRYVCLQSLWMCAKQRIVGDDGAVDKSVGMGTFVRCESVGMRGSILWH